MTKEDQISTFLSSFFDVSKRYEFKCMKRNGNKILAALSNKMGRRENGVVET